MSVWELTPVRVLQRAMARCGWPSLLSSRRYRRGEGRPGEIVQGLSSEEREVLRGLRSTDIDSSHVDRDVPWLGYGGCREPGELLPETVESMRLDFDRRELQMGPPRKMPWKAKRYWE